MNNIYKSIWNEATGTFVAVSENTGSGGKKASTCTSGGSATAFAMTAIALSLMTMGASADAAPVGGVVVAGAATISGAPGSMVITQTTPNAAINWQRFDIAAGESVRFVQPNSNSVALNRVLGSDPSSILGTLSANGKVFLVNPNGILFGKGASVNVAGLVASSLNIDDADFMTGNYSFSGAGNGAVVNLGAINAPGGYVALLGANVSNDGVIAARLGSVALAAGNAMTLDVAGDGLLNVAIGQGAVDALVQNGGLIQADGGHVLLSARAAGGLLQGAVNNSGVIEARSLQAHNGTIRLVGDAHTGIVEVSGKLDASGLAAGQTGGTVQVLGDTVKLAAATVNASGDAGGGLVQIGGTFYGDDTLPASRITVLDGATVHANAIGVGNGGRIAVWSDGDTSVNATLTARGGASGGNGGFVETSGKRVVLGVDNRVDTLAPHGKTGIWLLDPINWTIADAGGDETPEQVRTSLASSDRLISVTNDITVADALVWTTGQKLELNAGHDVLIKAAMTASTAGSAIVLIAGNDVLVDAAITASAMDSRISMSAGRDITNTAAITASATGARIDMSAGRNVSVVAVTADGGGSIGLVARNDVTASSNISADGGAVSLVADNDGTGPGAAGGTVRFIGPGSVSAIATTIRFNPVTYAATSTEIADYTAKVAAGSVDARAWVFAQGDNKVYDGSRTATLSLRGNPEISNSVALVAGSATFDNKNVGTSKPITFESYALGGADGAKFDLFAPIGATAGSGATTAAITPRPLEVTATGVNKVYDGATSDPVALADNRIAGDLLTVTSAAANFDTPSVGNGKAVSVTGISVTGADAANYSANASAMTAADITPAPLTVRANNAAKTYGETLALSPAAFTQTGLVNGESIAGVSLESAGTVATADVAGSPFAIIPSNASGGTFSASNYTITYVNGGLVISPAPLAVRAGDASKAYGETAVLTGFTTSGLVNGDSIGSVTLASPGTVATAAAGSYAIMPSEAAGGTFTPSNYAIVYAEGALTVRAPVVAPPEASPETAPEPEAPPTPVITPMPVSSAPVVAPQPAVDPIPPIQTLIPAPALPGLTPARPVAVAAPSAPTSAAAPALVAVSRERLVSTPPVVTPVSVVPSAMRPDPMPVTVLPVAPAGLRTLPPAGFVEPQPEAPALPAPAVPAIPEAPVIERPPGPALDLPVRRIRKQDRN